MKYYTEMTPCGQNRANLAPSSFHFTRLMEVVDVWQHYESNQIDICCAQKDAVNSSHGFTLDEPFFPPNVQ